MYICTQIARYYGKEDHKIPHIAEELRIGYSFNYLIKLIAETEYVESSFSLSYLISELFDNIYEHSQSKNGYVFSQYLEVLDRYVEIWLSIIIPAELSARMARLYFFSPFIGGGKGGGNFRKCLMTGQ